MYRFPENLYADIRIEHKKTAVYRMQNGEVKDNSEAEVSGAMIRVYDGKMWYTSVTNDLDSIQAELDGLAAVAEPNADIADDPVVKKFEVHKDRVLRFEGDNDVRKITRASREDLVRHYISACIDESIPEMKQWYAGYSQAHIVKEFYSSKGAEIVQDYQQCGFWIWYDFVVNDIKTSGGRNFRGMDFNKLSGHEQEIIERRDRYLDFAKNAVEVTPGHYVSVLNPEVT